MGRRLTAAILACLVVAVFAAPVGGGVVVYEKDGKKVEIGGRIQLQYMNTDEEGGDDEDEIFFRRLRPYVAGTVTENWWGKIQFDFGKADDNDEVAVKDAYMQYRGWENLTLTIGNSKTPFSREFLASSKRQQTVERGFVGDHNFGTPDRQLGVKLEGQNDSKRVTWALALGGENHDPDVRRIDFDTPANNRSDWNEGIVFAGRVDFHPRGFVELDQGDFHSDGMRFNFSLAAFGWSNDDDNNTFTSPITGLGTSSGKADLDSATGFEVSAGLRGRGVSIDGEYQIINADTVDPTFTGGVYRGGTTVLDKHQLEGGYMFRGNRFELVAALERLDADNYQDAWERTELGFNYFWNRHKAKVQFTFSMGENVFGVRDAEGDTSFLQFQYVF